jgi:hypothetical protein
VEEFSPREVFRVVGAGSLGLDLLAGPLILSEVCVFGQERVLIPDFSFFIIVLGVRLEGKRAGSMLRSVILE